MKGTKVPIFEVYYGSNSEEPRMFLSKFEGIADLSNFSDEELTIIPVTSAVEFQQQWEEVRE